MSLPYQLLKLCKYWVLLGLNVILFENNNSKAWKFVSDKCIEAKFKKLSRRLFIVTVNCLEAEKIRLCNQKHYKLQTKMCVTVCKLICDFFKPYSGLVLINPVQTFNTGLLPWSINTEK